MEKGSFLPLNMEKKHSVSEDTGGHFPRSPASGPLCARGHTVVWLCVRACWRPVFLVELLELRQTPDLLRLSPGGFSASSEG